MASKKKPTTSTRTRGKDANPRKFKKKTSPLVIDKVEYVDYKDVDLLSRFMSDRAKIRNQRVSGNTVQQQRDIANAIKIAREMGLLPYAKRVSSSGRSRPPRDGDNRRSRDESSGTLDVSEDLTLDTGGIDEGEDFADIADSEEAGV
jgi:small subunit ribosomal protein S18